ncbi:MAG TPA: TetR/AcrR family transcriptional regulator [Gammaproteobacteria bacterium]|nr:TetR/AcrR family transcriptional regulator [Gammaproteobacteria bacterium]
MAKRLKAAERRASILAVAKLLFADKGYHGVAVDEIARRLGVSPAVLYRHFPSKEALYAEVLDTLAAQRESYVDAALQDPDDFGSVLLRMTLVFAESVARDPDYLKMEMLGSLEDAQVTRQFFESRWKSFTDYIEYSLRELAETGQASSRVNPRTAGLMFQGMVREALYAKCIHRDSRYRELPLTDLIRQLVGLFLDAVHYKTGRSE